MKPIPWVLTGWHLCQELPEPVDKLRGISTESYKKYFSNGVFMMEDDCPIPNEIVSSLGLIGSKTLVAGKHSVIERSGILYISIPVK